MKLAKGKCRCCLTALCLFTIIVLIYLTFAGEKGSNVHKTHSNANNNNPHNNQMYDLNELLPLTLTPENVASMQLQEKLIIQQAKFRSNPKTKSENNGVVLDRPESHFRGGGDTAQSGKSNGLFKHKFIHLDVKGAPPVVSYLKQLFPFLRILGATGLLIEYEDMFPYSGLLEGIRAYNSYTTAEIEEILKAAEDNDLEVIPLIQAFGHMEFVLKSEQFKILREVPSYPQAICPSNNFSTTVLQEMIDQILRLHPKSKYIHVGCDEVYNIGECPLCQERMSKMGWNIENLFLNHVASITRYAKTKHNVQPIMWDDMFRDATEESILAVDIGKYTDILVWKYSSNVEDAISREVWAKYARCFNGIWVASAFKGATNPVTYATPIEDRLENHKSWVKLIQDYPSAPVKGIFLTGWQRYDHFATLCELLPAGLPSIAVNLQYLLRLNYDPDVARDVQTYLGCNKFVPLTIDVLNSEITCSFPGSRIYELSLAFYALNYHLNEQFFESNYVKGWISEYNVNHRFSSPALLEQATLRYSEGVRNVTVFKSAMMEALSLAYDKYTVNEWIETLVQPLLKKLDAYMADIRLLLTQSTWPRRPLTEDGDKQLEFEISKSMAAETDLSKI
ncbi:hypothetical protein CHUAL_008525 [Chamberlinius hualienensis]